MSLTIIKMVDEWGERFNKIDSACGKILDIASNIGI